MIRKIALLGLLAIGATALSAQSPWTRSKGGYYAQAAYHFIPTYAGLFGSDDTQDTRPIDREISEQTLQLYGEYGVGNSTTVMASIPFRMMRSGAFLNNTAMPGTTEGSLNSLGNVSLGLRQKFVSGKVLFSGTLQVDLPTGSYDDSTGLRTDYDATTILPTLNVGTSWGKSFGYAYAGYGYRSNEYSHFFKAGLEAGTRLGPVLVIAFSDFVVPFENGSINLPVANEFTGLYVDNQGWVSIGLKGIYEINKHLGVFVSGAGAFWGQSVPQNPGIGIGLFSKMD
jgi:hypothetical protein